MSDREELQCRALQEIILYSNHLIPALQKVIHELKEDKHPDTKSFLGEVITGINWEIEVYNQCSRLIHEKTNYIDKKDTARAVQRLGKVINSNNDELLADCLERDFLPFLNKLALASQMVLNSL